MQEILDTTTPNISIHALREESDRRSVVRTASVINFNPRSP